MATRKKLSDDAQELLGWIEDGWYDTENDLEAIAEQIALRFAHLRHVTDNPKAHKGPVTGDLLIEYRYWWITKRAELKRDGVSDKEMVPMIGSTAHSAYAEMKKDWEDIQSGEVVLVFPTLAKTVKRRKMLPVWRDADGGMKWVLFSTLKITSNYNPPTPYPEDEEEEDEDE